MLFLIISPYKNTFLHQENFSDTIAKFCETDEELNNVDLNEFEFIIDFRNDNEDFMYQRFKASKSGLSDYKKLGLLEIHKKDDEQDTNYISLNYKKLFIVSNMLPTNKKEKVLINQNVIKAFFYKLVRKCTLKNTTSKKNAIISSGIEVNNFIGIDSDVTYKLIDDIRFVENKKEKKVEYISLNELNMIKDTHIEILKTLSDKFSA